MSKIYSFKTIEEKWQKYWYDTKVFTQDNQKEKFYCLVMFPYPSGSLHMGHVRNYSIGDVIAWYKRLCGFDVIHPIGWDSFGQPAEQAAIKNNVQPKDWTEKNIEYMKGQLKRLGISYDWSRELATHKKEYYIWNQWFFLQMFKKGLVYRKFSPVNWCPKEKTVLSNEQAANGICWRCGVEVVEKELNQWFIKTTQYSEELLNGLEKLSFQGWPKSVLKMQKNWIGKTETIDLAGSKVISYNFHDWGVSRQRFWGTPIPIVHCLDCGIVAVKEEDLPISLPEQAEFTGEGESPLAKIIDFVKTTCPNCGKEAKRETDTMDTFVDSAWYYFRYTDPNNTSRPFSSEKAIEFLPVNLYVGGVEHAVMHLLYTRFWCKMMRDIGLVNFDEPIKKLVSQGMVMGLSQSCFKSFWRVMSKSLGNGVSPDLMVEKYGVDALRMFILFAAPTEDELRWDEKGILGTVKFLSKVYKMVNDWQELTNTIAVSPKKEISPIAIKINTLINQTVEGVTKDIERFHFNTCISFLMKFVNGFKEINQEISKMDTLTSSEVFIVKRALEKMILLMSPFAPHIAEECWQILGNQKSILESNINWPKTENDIIPLNGIEYRQLLDKLREIVVQINGKFCTTIQVSDYVTEKDIEVLVLADRKVKSKIDSKKVAKIIVVKRQIVNVVVA
jgi:leucyl-tRNA synthetase